MPARRSARYLPDDAEAQAPALGARFGYACSAPIPSTSGELLSPQSAQSALETHSLNHPPSGMFDLADLSSLLDTRFLTALPSALAGAGLGAWTAQRIAARNKKTDERLKEIRAANAAATIAYGITDDMLDMKHQIIKPVVDLFEIERERFMQEDALPKPPGATTIIFSASMPVFRFNWSPAKDLQDIVFDDVSAPMRPMWVLPALTRACSMLDILTADRNEMIKHFQDVQKAGKEIDPHAFYGVRFPKGGADKRFADTLQHISQFTDNAIIFSHLVGDDLRESGPPPRKAVRRTPPPVPRSGPRWSRKGGRSVGRSFAPGRRAAPTTTALMHRLSPKKLGNLFHYAFSFVSQSQKIIAQPFYHVPCAFCRPDAFDPQLDFTDGHLCLRQQTTCCR
jgi:hypothetical protein